MSYSGVIYYLHYLNVKHFFFKMNCFNYKLYRFKKNNDPLYILFFITCLNKCL